eukprot:348702-Pleurochrysis_carterae.AAC.1
MHASRASVAAQAVARGARAHATLMSRLCHECVLAVAHAARNPQSGAARTYVLPFLPPRLETPVGAGRPT